MAGIASWMEVILLDDGGRGTGLETTECGGEACSNEDGTPPILLDLWMVVDEMPPWLATLPPIKTMEETLWYRTSLKSTPSRSGRQLPLPSW